MSVQDPNTIDFVSLGTKLDTALLVVSDHLDWSSPMDHQFALQEKLNAYLSFIETQELYSQFPKAKGKRVEIRVVLQYVPDASGTEFLQKVAKFIAEAGFTFSYQVGIDPVPPNHVN